MPSNLERAQELQSRLILMRQYLGDKAYVSKLWGFSTPVLIGKSDQWRLKALTRLARDADRLGVELHFDIKLPKN